MTSTLTADIEGNEYVADLTQVTAVDGLTWRMATGEELDARLTYMIINGPEDAALWGLVDRATIYWLALRAAGAAVSVAAAFEQVTMWPADDAPAAEAGVVDAPVAEQTGPEVAG